MTSKLKYDKGKMKTETNTGNKKGEDATSNPPPGNDTPYGIIPAYLPQSNNCGGDRE